MGSSGNIRRSALDAHAAVGVDGRQEIGALDPVLGAGLLHVQRGHPQVAVIGERHGNELLQLGINEEPIPFQVNSSVFRPVGAAAVCRSGRPCRGNRRLRPRVARRHGAAGHTDDADACDYHSADHVSWPPVEWSVPIFRWNPGIFSRRCGRSGRRKTG